MIAGLHHVQLAMPRGQEAAAREFYAGVLGMTEVPKPPHLAVRGGVWFSAGSTQVHLGVEEDFRPAKKAQADPSSRISRSTDSTGATSAIRSATGSSCWSLSSALIIPNSDSCASPPPAC